MESVADLQSRKRNAIVSHGMTRGCSLAQFRTGCIADATTITTDNPCDTCTDCKAQEDGSNPVPPEGKACSWIPSQPTTKRLKDNQWTDSQPSPAADYYLTSAVDNTSQAADGFAQVLKQNGQNGAVVWGQKALTFGNINNYMGYNILLRPNKYGYRRTQFDTANRRACCLGAGTFQQGAVDGTLGFRPLGASCTSDKDCLAVAWDGTPLDTICKSSTKQSGGVCVQSGANSGSVASPKPGDWSPNPNNVWSVVSGPSPTVCDTVWTPGTPQKDADPSAQSNDSTIYSALDPRSQSADALWAASCGQEVVLGAKPWCEETVPFNSTYSSNPDDYVLEDLADYTGHQWTMGMQIPIGPDMGCPPTSSQNDQIEVCSTSPCKGCIQDEKAARNMAVKLKADFFQFVANKDGNDNEKQAVRFYASPKKRISLPTGPSAPMVPASLARTIKRTATAPSQSNTCATPVLTQEGHAGQQACTVPTACTRRMVPCAASGTWATTRTARPPTACTGPCVALLQSKHLSNGATGRHRSAA